MKPTYILLGLAIVVLGVGAAVAATRLTTSTPSSQDEMAAETMTPPLSGEDVSGAPREGKREDSRSDEREKGEESKYEVEDESENDSPRADAVGTGSSIPAQPPTPTIASYSAAEVAKHGGEASCWTIVRGEVYDVTAWIGEHPGGERSILSMCGKDATSAFEGKHGGDEKPEAELTKYKIGILR